MDKSVGTYLKEWLLRTGLEENLAIVVKGIAVVFFIVLLSFLADFITKKIILRVLKVIARRTKNTWDDVMFEKKVFNRLSHLAPAIVVYLLTPMTFKDYPTVVDIVQAVSKIYMVVILIWVIDSFFNALYGIYQNFEVSRSKPIKGYIQIFKILVYLVGGIIMVSIMINKSPVYLLTGLGAFTAVLLFVFKDPILGLIGSIQISANDMLKPGDWITIPDKGVDGTVVDISLTTVKVQNGDKTILTVPTYSLVSDAFQNWKGIEEAGVRRIRRQVFVNMHSVKTCDEPLLSALTENPVTAGFMKDALKDETTLEDEPGREAPSETAFLTNLGLFRHFLHFHLQGHPLVNKDMTLVVRQLQPTDSGLPVEVFAYLNETDWARFEEAQSLIFEMIFAVMPLFGLKVFQNPSGIHITG